MVKSTPEDKTFRLEIHAKLAHVLKDLQVSYFNFHLVEIILTPSYTGLNGKGCRDTHCLVDNRVGCVPVYTENVCCPTSYKCGKMNFHLR